MYIPTSSDLVSPGFYHEVWNTEEGFRHRLVFHGSNKNPIEGQWVIYNMPASLEMNGYTYLFYQEGTSYTERLPENVVIKVKALDKIE